MNVLDTVWIFPGFPVMLEVFMIGVLIALVGAFGYTYFISSMENDSDAKWMEDYISLWDELSGADQPQKKKLSKVAKIRIILLIVAILVLVLFILAKSFGWF